MNNSFNLTYNEAQLLNTFRELPPTFQSNLLERAYALKTALEIKEKDRIKLIVCNTTK